MGASVSPSISPSLSPSVSPSISPSISPSVSPSASISPSVSPSPSLSPSYEPAFSVTHLVTFKGNSIKLVKITLRKYVNGGIPITAGECGLRVLRALIAPGTAAGYPIWWHQAGGTLLCYSAVGTEMANDAGALVGTIIYALAVGY